MVFWFIILGPVARDLNKVFHYTTMESDRKR